MEAHGGWPPAQSVGRGAGGGSGGRMEEEPAQGAGWAGTQSPGSSGETGTAGAGRVGVHSQWAGLLSCPPGGLRGLLLTSPGGLEAMGVCASGCFSIRVGQAFPPVAVFVLAQGTGKHAAMEPLGASVRTGCTWWERHPRTGDELVQGSRKCVITFRDMASC